MNHHFTDASSEIDFLLEIVVQNAVEKKNVNNENNGEIEWCTSASEKIIFN